jgi:TolB protein
MSLRTMLCALAAVFAAACASPAPPAPAPPSLGVFEAAGDVGDVGAPGSTVFDPAAGTYTITGSGHNMWADLDSFQFAWSRMEAGDVSIGADIAWRGEGQAAHRKAGVIIRTSLDPAAPYADVVVHGDGLVSMQYRSEQGGQTYQVISPISHAKRVVLERVGEYIYFSVAGEDGVLHELGGSVRIALPGPYYVGLVVCSHARGVSETAVFSNVEIKHLDVPVVADTGYPAQVLSSLEILHVAGGGEAWGNRRVVRHFDTKIEAPNWSRDGEYLIYNSGGFIYRIPVAGEQEPTRINTGALNKSNNDHGISPDGTQLVISDQSEPDNISRIHILPIDGADHPRVVASHPTARSYWHAFTTDGRSIIYTANRPDLGDDYDIFIKPIAGGRERNLTRSPGLDDGPDVSPDGQWIYFNSTRSGNMKIWRMRADGSNPEQVTFEADTRDWFPHPSPDGKWLVFVSFGLDVDLSDHPPNRNATLRVMPMDGSAPPRVIATLFGGQGTINVPSWSPDSTRVAFVSYRLRDGKPPPYRASAIGVR